MYNVVIEQCELEMGIALPPNNLRLCRWSCLSSKFLSPLISSRKMFCYLSGLFCYQFLISQFYLTARVNKVMKRQSTFVLHHASHPWSRSRVLIWMVNNHASYIFSQCLLWMCLGWLETLIIYFVSMCLLLGFGCPVRKLHLEILKDCTYELHLV